MTEDMACRLEKVPEGYIFLDIGLGGAKKDKGFTLLRKKPSPTETID